MENGYNCSEGGNQQSVGENNGRAKLKAEDVIAIRTAYANHKRQKEVYKEYKDKITFAYFQNLWQGRSWMHIMPEVFTEENKKYYATQATNGELSKTAIFTNEEVINLRKRYVNETAAEIYKSCSDRCSYDTFQKMLWGHTYSSLPLYKKKTREWINI